MNYQFPIIKNIDDVLPSIKGRDDFKIIDKGEYIIIDYVYIQPDSFDCNIRRECRGITFDSKTGNIISRPFHKFFNLGEREETQPNNINLNYPHKVLHKMDGSMIRPCLINNELVLMTRKGITDVAVQSANEVQISTRIFNWMLNCLNDNLTPIYEFVSPKNKIVIEYESPELILLALRDNFTGEYLPIYNDKIDAKLSFSVPHTIRDFVNIQKGIEGYVIRFDDGHMIKIKTEEYVRLHKTIDIFESEKNILQIILNQETDDLYPLLEKDKADRLRKFEKKINNFIILVDHIISNTVDLWKDKDQKDFALTVQKEMPKYYWPLMFDMRKNPDKDYDIVRKHLLRFCTSSTKIEEIRQTFLYGLTWEDF